jgi:hypothetical protein
MDGPPVRFIGNAFPTRMISVKLSAGSLWVNSPVNVSAQELDGIRQLGVVRYLVAPTKLPFGGCRNGTRFSQRLNYGSLRKSPRNLAICHSLEH